MSTTPALTSTDVSDDDVFDQAVGLVSRPKSAPANSFELHAPLELMARRILLDRVEPGRQAAARARITWVADTYAQSGEPVADDEPAPAPVGPDELVACLSAAGHAPIYNYLLPRVARRSPGATALARPLLHELNRFREWKIEWIDAQPFTGSGDQGALTRALLETPHLGMPGSDFIFPLMHQVDSKGVAADVIGPVLGPATDAAATARAVARVAAWSMLQDEPAHAPYGWTHCLTLAQAAAAMATSTTDPLRALAVAATHVVGFRAALSNAPVTDRYEPEPVDVDPLEALDASPQLAAAAVHHAPRAAVAAISTELASSAALHPDAHVAKYTLACFDAADADPEHGRLFLSAAAYLHGWWSEPQAAGA
jgi:hypothetical protein